MARELGMNPKKIGKQANHKQEPWKTPLPVFIENLYLKRFGKRRPDKVLSIEQLVKNQAKAKTERRKQKQLKKQEPPMPKNKPGSLTKADIISTLTNHIGIPKKKAADTTETLLEIIKKTLESGEDVLISGFGKFCVKQKEERRGRNPATGDDMMLVPRKVVTFKCSGKLRDKVNEVYPTK